MIEKCSSRECEIFSRVFELATVGLCLVSLEGQCVRVNQRLCQMFGYDAEDMIGQAYDKFIFPGELLDGNNIFNQLLEGTCESVTAEKRFLKSGEVPIWCRRHCNCYKRQLWEHHSAPRPIGGYFGA